MMNKLNCAHSDKDNFYSHNFLRPFILTKDNTFCVQREVTSDEIIEAAKTFLYQKLKTYTISISNSDSVRDYLSLELASEKSEVFCVMFLTNKNKLICFEKIFQGSIKSAEVFPREILRRAIEHNAAAIILAHNHPSGDYEPSDSDVDVTEKLAKLLKLIDVSVLDHFIIAADQVYSFYEHGFRNW
ncbi:MAG: hypothetical protein COV52_02005 [Gammaproteobacteria bacterium CG11_big_fil_rev_8_21_14_0_20_46_22]|nr:MAG: hypothetical protein COW05_05900 [Gammaproteobacteria bacterium CG12_big_fil_rev_8_21_14_0_65_46_12]PIR11889.1 MAG: hypothetical protein COV52_02005 [Gammaproteobacteria bacterium CG11_big_fil_rev_8_21_14_0_20_46_22]